MILHQPTKLFSQLSFSSRILPLLVLSALVATPLRAVDVEGTAAAATVTEETAGQEPAAEELLGKWRALPKEDKLLYANVAMGSAILAWGLATWDYGSRSFKTASEGWFGQNTKEGGADKLGHLYGTYATTRGLSWLYGEWGYQPTDAARYGALSALGLQTLMEVGDGFSNYGFAWQDMVMNTVGAGVGYLLATHTDLARKLDLRVEYKPNTDSNDIFTDYEHQRYLMAVKLDGFDAWRDSPAGYLELHLGYYARGYETNVPELSSRHVYAGVAINLSRLLDEAGHHKTASFLRYYQPPYTSLRLSKRLSR